MELIYHKLVASVLKYSGCNLSQSMGWRSELPEQNLAALQCTVRENMDLFSLSISHRLSSVMMMDSFQNFLSKSFFFGSYVELSSSLSSIH